MQFAETAFAISTICIWAMLRLPSFAWELICSFKMCIRDRCEGQTDTQRVVLRQLGDSAFLMVGLRCRRDLIVGR